MDDINSTLQDLQRRVADNGLIFTSGGIGPTHDDVTYEGVAKACGEVSLRMRCRIVKSVAIYTLGCRFCRHDAAEARTNH